MSKKANVPGAKQAAGPTCLLDGNVLVALMSTTHIHHDAAERWFESYQGNFATCPTTQGTLLRLVMQLDQVPVETAVELLMHLVADVRHRFWPDDLPYAHVYWRGVLGHRQVTDAYLATLARHHGGKLASFDRGLVALHPDVAIGLE
jgi:uncharacterized protein